MRYYCSQVNDKSIDKNIKVFGWVAKRRDHGGIIFIDLRDHTGILQLVFNPDNKDLFKKAESIRSEFVICVQGTVNKRLEGAVNKDIPSGSIEIIVSKLETLFVSSELAKNKSEVISWLTPKFNLKTSPGKDSGSYCTLSIGKT